MEAMRAIEIIETAIVEGVNLLANPDVDEALAVLCDYAPVMQPHNRLLATDYALAKIIDDDVLDLSTATAANAANILKEFFSGSHKDSYYSCERGAEYCKETFWAYIVNSHCSDDSPIGDFARDMRDDDEFPREMYDRFSDGYTALHQYLRSCSACDGAFDAFEDAWREYANAAGLSWIE